MNHKIFNWFYALIYVVFIYSTLTLVPIPMLYLRSHGVLRLTIQILFLLTISLLIFFMFQKKLTAAWRFVLLGGTLGAYIFCASKIKIPEEQVHFFEYGFVGVLFFRAIRQHFEATWKSYVLAFILGSLAGWLDEILQGFTARRHYDVHDIYLNMLSVTLGLILYAATWFQKKDISFEQRSGVSQ